MTETEVRALDSRMLPEHIDYYIIKDDGTLEESSVEHADVFIDEYDMLHLADPDTVLYIKNNYGACVGIMHETDFKVFPRECRTAQMLLGIVKK